MDLQLPEGEVAELPAHMQQALPDVSSARVTRLTAIVPPSLRPDMDIAGV